MDKQGNESKFLHQKYIDVDTGEVRVSSDPITLRVSAVGSCVALVAYEPSRKIGGLAHIMLPGRAPERESGTRTKYAEDAIDDLLKNLENLGAKTENLEISLVGGANVLAEGTISHLIVNSVLDYLKTLGIEPKRKSLGGTQRRSVCLDVDSGEIFYTEGDSQAKEL